MEYQALCKNALFDKFGASYGNVATLSGVAGRQQILVRIDPSFFPSPAKKRAFSALSLPLHTQRPFYSVFAVLERRFLEGALSHFSFSASAALPALLSSPPPSPSSVRAKVPKQQQFGKKEEWHFSSPRTTSGEKGVSFTLK